MRRAFLTAFCLLFTGLAAASLLVSASQSRETRFLPMLGDDVVLHMMAIAAAAQPEAGIGWDERGDTLLSVEEARRVVDLAAASASAAWCGIDWQRANFEPLMSDAAKRAVRSPEALAYIARLHDVAKDMFERDLRAAACPPRQKAAVSRFLVNRWKSNPLVLAAVEGRAARP